MDFNQKKEIAFSADVQNLIGFIVQYEDLSQHGVSLMTDKEIEMLAALAEKHKSLLS